ncbi:hypothetical protein OSC27_07025 [Microbacterium sp. STN6]|uniref:hypothetical protein n=1 Tax=Microbacterium sp. STN6 TaxID=2995588 RepID=UPI002260E749|nr:hypothetical protein [Microbacterium sp. STN6]MCX7522029.1 hypothetical protein [Microbacterium sp. STN6]
MRDYSTLDYAPLTAAVDQARLAAFRRQARSQGISASTVLTYVVFAFVALVFLAVGGSFVSAFVAVGATSAGPGLLLWPIVVLVLLALVVWAAIAASRRSWRRRYRLHAFALANGLQAIGGTDRPAFSGAIFGVGSDRTVYDRIRSTDAPFIELGDYRYTTGSGKNRTTHRWGYLAIRLERRLPQMVLDARANNGLFGATNLPSHFARDQVLKLEGDFNRYFTLYCPREYEQDALYVFTPDLMALLIDNAGTCDVEIIDDWMFVYSASPFDMCDRRVLETLFRIVDTVGRKTLRQSGRYRDDRVITDAAADPAGRVAPGGRRLRTGVNWLGVVVAVAAVAYWVWASILH